MAQKYDENSIKVLKGLDGVRHRPSMYIGNVNEQGFHHLIWEILDNATDEAVSGEADSINIIIHKDGSVSIADNGRGIPIKDHPTEKIPTIDVVFTVLHAGGKFDNTNEESAFKTSSGTHGVGASVVNALSDWLEVTVRRDGKEFFRRYENGNPTRKSLEITKTGLSKKETGTCVQFMANKSVFKNVSGYNKNIIIKRLRELSYLNSGVSYRLIWESKDKEDEIHLFKSERGIAEYLDYLTKDKKLIHTPIHISAKNINKCDAEIAFVYDDQYNTNTFSFANNVATHDHGVHMNAALDSLVKTIENIADSSGMLKELDLNICKKDIQEGLNLIVSVKLPDPQYEGQTKGRLNNEEIRKPLGEWALDLFVKELKKDKEAGKAIASKIVETIKARDAAQKARNLVRKRSGIDNTHLAGKLSDCSSKDVEKCELFLVEGQSAGGTAKDARDRKYQAVLPLKGKVLNVSKTTLNTALENKEIASIISALGVRIEHGGCNLDGLRYHKIILSCDADSDGGHIGCLLFSLFYKFMPQIIENGHLYVCDLPLYRVAMNTKTYYLKDDKALEEFKTKHSMKKMEISRFKGLGEMNVEDYKELAMAQETRLLKQITVTNAKETQELLEKLMGDDAGGRKEYLMEHLNFHDI